MFSADGLAGAVRNGTVVGPDFAGTYDLQGTVDLDVNTTGASVAVDFDGNGSTDANVQGTAGGTYIKATVSNAVLTVAGNELSADTFYLEKNGDDVIVAGTNPCAAAV